MYGLSSNLKQKSLTECFCGVTKQFLVFETIPVGVELLFYVNAFFFVKIS